MSEKDWLDKHVEFAAKQLEQAEADAASLRQEVERLKIEQTRADIYGEVVAEWRPIVQEAEALRQAQVRLTDENARFRAVVKRLESYRTQHIRAFKARSAEQTQQQEETENALLDAVLHELNSALASGDPLPVSKET